MSRKSLVVIPLLLFLGACTVGPKYKRPQVDVPGTYRGEQAGAATTAAAPSTPPAESFAEMKWFAVFQDPVLNNLIKEALQNNYDIKIAASRVAQAGAILGITRADQYPQISASASVENIRNKFYQGAPTLDTATIQMSYVIDFWGQYRRASEAARANLVATQYGQAVVRTTLVADVATAYFQLRQYDAQIDYAKQTLVADQEILRINTAKFKGGESAQTDVLQAQLLVQEAEANIITFEEAAQQTENVLSILLGKDPGPIARGQALFEQPHLPEVPVGLPSSLLQRRPDIMQAEQILVSANANVGVAKAAFFPQLALTGLFGAQSTSVASFLNGPATVWDVGGQVLQPVFQGGRIRSNYRLAWARRDEAELQYKRTVLQAFGEVSNSLVGYNKSREYRTKITEQTGTYKEAARLANVRFLGGSTSFLEVLVTQQQYLTSQLLLARAWNTELQSYVQLYRALGGGWQL